MSLTQQLHTLSYGWLGQILEPLTGRDYDAVQILRTPPFLWRGDAGQGRWLTAGHLAFSGQHIKFDAPLWQDDTIMHHNFWGAYARSFSFLRDLRALGGDAGRLTARNLVKDWAVSAPYRKRCAMQPGETAKRLNEWLTHFDFYGQTAPDQTIRQIMRSMLRQAHSLMHYPARHIDAYDVIHVAKALLLVGICMNDQDKAYRAGQQMLHKALQEQILPDGGHISRSPLVLLDWAETCLDLQALCQQHHMHRDLAFLPSVIERMALALRFMTMPDGQLPFMHGGYIGHDSRLDTAKKLLENIKNKKLPKGLDDSGYKRFKAGRLHVIADCGGVPSFKYNSLSHAGLASFELYYGKEKLITNCGAQPISQQWGVMLKSTAAHSTLVLDDRNACEILPDGHIGHAPAYTTAKTAPWEDGGEMIEISHDGYMAALSTRHTRRLYSSHDGRSFAGQDILVSDIRRAAPLEYSVRFHLHPMVKASFIKDRQEILLRLPSGKGASFSCHDAILRLEDSIIIGRDLNPRKAQQIVLEGRFSGGVEQTDWLLRFAS